MRLIHADLLHFIFFGPTIHAQGTSTSLRYQHEVAAFQRFNVSAIEPLQIIVSLRGFFSWRPTIVFLFTELLFHRDTSEERAVAKICGYPLCSNPILKDVMQK